MRWSFFFAAEHAQKLFEADDAVVILVERNQQPRPSNIPELVDGKSGRSVAVLIVEDAGLAQHVCELLFVQTKHEFGLVEAHV